MSDYVQQCNFDIVWESLHELDENDPENEVMDEMQIDDDLQELLLSIEMPQAQG